MWPMNQHHHFRNWRTNQQTSQKKETCTPCKYIITFHWPENPSIQNILLGDTHKFLFRIRNKSNIYLHSVTEWQQKVNNFYRQKETEVEDDEHKIISDIKLIPRAHTNLYTQRIYYTDELSSAQKQSVLFIIFILYFIHLTVQTRLTLFPYNHLGRKTHEGDVFMGIELLAIQQNFIHLCRLLVYIFIVTECDRTRWLFFLSRIQMEYY